jgi:predicted GNAT family N-acyltransferase
MARPVELTGSDAADLVALYDDYSVWADRDADRVAAAIEGSDVALGLQADEGNDGDEDDDDKAATRSESGADAEASRLVAAARVVTDRAYYATVYDLVVAENRRGEGLGHDLLAAVVDHEALDDVPRLTAACREGLTGFYADCGFERSRETVKHDGREEPLVHMVYHR